jgi:CII-binding regulator of phage lambda lysogenization HflD
MAITTAIWSRWDDLRIDVPIVAIQMTIFLLTLKRGGLLSLITAVYVDLLTVALPLTIDISRFYFLSSAVVTALIVILLLAGLRAALTERRSPVPL